MCASRLQRPEDAWELELQIIVNIHEVLESKLVLLQEQDVFLTTKPPLSSWPFFFFKHILKELLPTSDSKISEEASGYNVTEDSL